MCFIDTSSILDDFTDEDVTVDTVEPVSAGEDTPEANVQAINAMPRVFNGDNGRKQYVAVAFPNGRTIYVYNDGTTGENRLDGDTLRTLGLTELTAAVKVTEHTVETRTGPTDWPDFSSSVMEERAAAVTKWFEANGFSPAASFFVTQLAMGANMALGRYVKEQDALSQGGLHFLGQPKNVVALLLPIIAGKYASEGLIPNGATIEEGFQAELTRQSQRVDDTTGVSGQAESIDLSGLLDALSGVGASV